MGLEDIQFGVIVRFWGLDKTNDHFGWVSNGLDELYEILPFLLPCLDALPYRLKLRQSCEGILYIFGVFLAHDQKDGIIQLNDAISIDDPRCIRKVFQPFVRQHDFNLLVISVFLIECHHHLS